MRKLFIFALVATLGLASCAENQPNEDVVNTPNRDGSVEVNASTTDFKDSVAVQIDYVVYKNNQVVASGIATDTVPNLGVTLTEGSDADGNTQSVWVPKQYEIYFTVK